MRKAFVLASLLLLSTSAARAASGPCPVLPYKPGHQPQRTVRVPKQPATRYVSELEIQRQCNMWLNSFQPVVEFAPAVPARTVSAAARR